MRTYIQTLLHYHYRTIIAITEIILKIVNRRIPEVIISNFFFSVNAICVFVSELSTKNRSPMRNEIGWRDGVDLMNGTGFRLLDLLAPIDLASHWPVFFSLITRKRSFGLHFQ